MLKKHFKVLFSMVMIFTLVPANQALVVNAEEVKAPDFDADRGVEHIRHLSEDIGVRVAGTEEERQAIEYVKTQFEDMDYNVEIDEFEINTRKEDKFIINGEEIPLQSTRSTGLTAKEGIEAQIIDLKGGNQKKYPEEVKGNIVFIQRGETDFSAAARKAHDAGALGVIISDYTDAYRAFSPNPDISGGKIDIPLAGITKENGKKIKSILKENENTTAQLSVINHENQTSQNVIAVKEAVGVEDPDIVYVTSHIDSVPFAPGANDNGSGTGTILELARGMSNYDSDTEIRFIAFGAEEIGLVGSRYYANNLTEDELDRSIANFNFDMSASSWKPASSLNLNITDGKENNLSKFADEAATELDMDKSIINVFKKGSSDHESFHDVGIDSANFSWRVPGTGGLEPYYHSPADTMEHISTEKMGIIGTLASTALFQQFYTEPPEVEKEWMTNDEFLQKIGEIEENSSGKVQVDVAGQSSQGTDIMSTRVGTGDEVILINSSIHGNEMSGVEALVEMFDYLGTSDEPFAQSVRDEVTIVALPRFNVDGMEIPQRQNIFPWDEVVSKYPRLEGAEPAWYYNKKNGGFDINRDFNADLDYEVVKEDLPGNTLLPGFFITNEAQLLRDLYVELQNEFDGVEAFVDLHHMGTPRLNKSGDDVTIAVDYPPLGNDPTKYEDYPELDQDKSKRYSLAAALGVQEFSDTEETGVSQYVHFAERDYPGQARSALALNGSATVLFEMPGQQPKFGYDQELVDRVENGLWGIISRMADGSIDELDGDDFLTEIPRYWTDNVTDMRDVMERFTEEGQFENTSDARLLDNQLAAIEKYEEQENSEKLVKHLKAFKILIDDQKDKKLIENEAYNRFNKDADMLLDRWK